MRQAAREDDLDHALGGPLGLLHRRVQRADFTGAQELGECESESAQQSDLNEAAPAERREVPRSRAVAATIVLHPALLG